MRSFIPAVALFLASTAQAQAPQPVTLVSKTQAVVMVTDAKGQKKRALVDPKTVVPGQPIVIWLTYKNGGKAAANDFVINNPVAKGLDFTAFGEKSEWGIASVDGGKTFGPLASLKIANSDRTMRAATPLDVTHLRWVFAKPIPAGTGGTISFYAIVE